MRNPSGGDWNDDLRVRLAGLRLSPAREAEIVEELSQHLDDRYEELRAAGSSDADARRLALEELSEAGGLTQRMQSLSQVNQPAPVVPGQLRPGVLRGLWQDVQYAARTARRQPAFAATIVATLALGIAVNSTVFTIVNAVVLRPLPFRDADRLVRLNMRNVGNADNSVSQLSFLDFQDWRAARRTFERMAATVERAVDLSDDQQLPALVGAAYVSWNTFSLIGQLPSAGRDFTAADDRVDAPPAVILSGNLWRTRYGADPTVLGRTIRIDGIPSTVVGIMPPEVGFPDRAELWLPLITLPEADRIRRGVRIIGGVGRLRPGVTIEQAAAELGGITTSLAERYPESNRNTAPLVSPFTVAPQFIAITLALLGAVGFVLLIACANVANLMLARAADRARDVTLRLALGASRWRIVRRLLVESLVLSAAGGGAGLALSYPAVWALQRLPQESAPPSWVQFTLDQNVFAYLVVLCMGSALVCSLVPAWQASRPDLITTLNDTARGSAGRNRRRWMGTFVIAQVALALVLLTGAALMMQNLVTQLRTDVGVDSSGLMRTAFDLRRRDYDGERRLLFLNQLEERLASNPSINATLASAAPLGRTLMMKLRVDGESASADALPLVSIVHTGRRYFDVLSTPVLAGSALPADAPRQGSDDVVVNERFARMYFQDGAAVGRRLLLIEPDARADASEARWRTIVGVVGNVRQRMTPSGEFDPVVYAPYATDPPQTMVVLARSTSGSAAAAAFVGDQVRTLDPDLPLVPAITVAESLAQQLWPQRLFGSMFAIFASIAMLLAACGLYAVTSYAVSRRTREIGVRLALGADARSIWWAMAGTTVRQLAIGVALGTAGAAAVATILPALLVGTGSASYLAFAGVVIVLVAAGIIASALPARRAMRLDPVVALQAE